MCNAQVGQTVYIPTLSVMLHDGVARKSGVCYRVRPAHDYYYRADYFISKSVLEKIAGKTATVINEWRGEATLQFHDGTLFGRRSRQQSDTVSGIPCSILTEIACCIPDVDIGGFIDLITG